jgi:hypothetical protein
MLWTTECAEGVWIFLSLKKQIISCKIVWLEVAIAQTGHILSTTGEHMARRLDIVIAGVFAALFASSSVAQEAAAEADSPVKIEALMAPLDSNLTDFIWEKRPVVVFADSPNDPRFAQQIAFLEAQLDELAVRDVIILTDTDPEAKTALRTKLRPRGFMLVLIGKDGGVKLRKPFPWDVRELTRVIDKMPMRQREVRERRAAN